MKKYFSISNLFIGLFFTICLIALGLFLVIETRVLYYIDIRLLQIPEQSGIPADEIKRNYDALIAYCSPFFRGELIFPTLAASDNGLQHFVEVKRIFLAFYAAGLISLIGLLILIPCKKKKGDYTYLPFSGAFVLILPTVTAAAAAINFDQAFVVFHKIFFRNDLWYFDPVTDPVITILPDTFFLHCVLIIIAVVVIGSAVLLAIHLKRRKKYNSNHQS